ncbi:hypothetical protein ERO13_D05G226750v2 [Gossypium hirsutum]|uniref:Uncharacterized protein n=1 Tax=Gossypium tomentosum TaxID=34277 RepID=A0A5D2KZ92_GOSTO|nr:hypothetical protein ERO13_D05G226750v2 [Gossypium hirsutum]TYH72320.1 hypothetical protein ES332_D05G246700v1 [Gossypium tomentosum]
MRHPVYFSSDKMPLDNRYGIPFQYDLPGTHVKCKTKSSFTSPSFYNKSICNTYIRVSTCTHYLALFILS